MSPAPVILERFADWGQACLVDTLLNDLILIRKTRILGVLRTAPVNETGFPLPFRKPVSHVSLPPSISRHSLRIRMGLFRKSFSHHESDQERAPFARPRGLIPRSSGGKKLHHILGAFEIGLSISFSDRFGLILAYAVGFLQLTV